MDWEPLLEGDLAARALAMARDLACEIAKRPASPVDRTLFWAYASGLDDAFADSYDAALDELVTMLAAGARSTMLYNDGLCGIGWVLAHVLDTDADDPMLVAIDDAMLKVLAADRWVGDYDLGQGLVGHGVYFLERLRGGATRARDGLARVVGHLEALGRSTADGVCWHTAPELLPDYHRRRWPAGRYDCGVAHGAAGAIAMLARVSSIDGRARPLCAEAVRWLVAQRRAPQAGGGRFPGLVDLTPGTDFCDKPSRAAWCYGDPGVAIALWRAASALGMSEMVAYETARDCATRDPAICDIAEPGLCHGSAGLAHLLDRFYHASGDPVFRDGARRWFATTIDRYVGIQSFRRADEIALGLHDGAMGVALALLAAATAVEPCWDRMLLCDV